MCAEAWECAREDCADDGTSFGYQAVGGAGDPVCNRTWEGPKGVGI